MQLQKAVNRTIKLLLTKKGFQNFHEINIVYPSSLVCKYLYSLIYQILDDMLYFILHENMEICGVRNDFKE